MQTQLTQLKIMTRTHEDEMNNITKIKGMREGRIDRGSATSTSIT